MSMTPIIKDDLETRKRKVFKGTGTLVLVGMLYYLFVKVTGLGIPCVIHLLTGYDCPGCGMTRALSALIEFDFQRAYQYNALVFFLPIALGYAGYKAYRYIKYGDDGFKAWEIPCLLVALIIVVGYGVIRNI